MDDPIAKLQIANLRLLLTYKKYGSFKKIIAVKPKLQILRAACIYYVLKALTVKFYKLNFIFLLT